MSALGALITPCLRRLPLLILSDTNYITIPSSAETIGRTRKGALRVQYSISIMHSVLGIRPDPE
jgi:hypothetical protein